MRVRRMRVRRMRGIALLLSGVLMLNAMSVAATAMEIEDKVVAIELTEEVESEWFVDLKYAKAIDDNGNQIVFNSAVVTIPEDEGIYSIATTISGGTMSTTIPTLDDGTVVKASMNLAKTECVYTFTLDGEPAKITKEVAEEIIRAIIFVRNTGQDMEISATVDGAYTVLPDGMNITSGKDEDGLGGHFYAYVASSGISWSDAYNKARGMYYKGMQGYLVTIVRAEEDYILSAITTTSAWSGGSRIRYKSGEKLLGEDVVEYTNLDTTYNNFYWTAGPEGEVGVDYTITSGASNLGPADGAYNNWNSGEPNDYGGNEEYMHVFFTNYKWNDYPHQSSAVYGYFVEFGDTAVPTSGESDYYVDGGEGTTSGSDNNATSSTTVPNVRLNFSDDMIYDGESLSEPELSGGSSEMIIKYYSEDGKELDYSEIIDAGVYYAEINTGLTIVTQFFEVFPKPITLVYEGGPFVYNSKEQVPTITVNQEDLVVRVGNANIDTCEVTAYQVSLKQIARAISATRDGIEAGDHDIIASELSNSNYIVSNLAESYEYEITRKPIYATYTDTSINYTGATLAPTINLVGVEYSSEDVLDSTSGIASPAVTEPGNYTIATILDGIHANNYELVSGLTCNFTVNSTPVEFEMPGDVVEPGSTPVFTPTIDNTETEELNDRVPADIEYEVYYMDGQGNVYEGPEAPEEVGIYDVYITIVDDVHYRHEGTTSSDATKVGKIVVDVDGGDVSANASFGNIVYDDGNEESSVTDVLDVLDGTIVILQTPEKEGYVFLGWELDGKVYRAGERLEVQGDVEMIALWASTDGEHTVGQVVGNDGETGLAGATVTVWDGDQIIGQVVTDEDGNYDFGYSLPDGTYNMTVEKDGTTVTSKVEVENGKLDEEVQIFPEDGKSSIVQVLPGTTGVVVGNVDKLTDALEGEGIFMVTVDEEISDEFTEALEDVLLSEGIVVDLEIVKDGIEQDSIDELLEVIVKLPGGAQGHEEYWVYIYDEETGEIQEISTTPNEDGEYYEIGEDGKTITIYTNKTNTFVIDYFSPDRFEVVIPGTTGGTVTADIENPKAGDLVTLYPTPEEGFEFDKLIVRDEEGNELEVIDNGDGSYSFIQPLEGQVSIEAVFVEIEEQNPSIDKDPTVDLGTDTDKDPVEDLLGGTLEDDLAELGAVDTSDNTNSVLYLMLAIMSLSVMLFQRKRVR